MSINALYADWPEGSRRTWGWAALILVLPTSYLLSNIPVLIGMLVYLFSTTSMEQMADPEAAQELAGQLPPLEIFFPMLLSQFIAWALIIFFWFKVFERRSLASIGMGSHKAIRHLILGFVIGVILVVFLGLGLAAFHAIFPSEVMQEALAETNSFDLNHLNPTGLAPIFLAIIVFFLIQGGIEEVVVRGWLMSTLTARWGIVPGVLVSSIGFALLHVQHIMTYGVDGIIPIIGIFFTGLFFALLAVYQRSIWGAITAHGAFNATAILGPVTAALASNPDLDVSEAITSIFEQAAGLAEGVEVGSESFVQSIVFALLSLVLLVLIMRRRGR